MGRGQARSDSDEWIGVRRRGAAVRELSTAETTLALCLIARRRDPRFWTDDWRSSQHTAFRPQLLWRVACHRRSNSKTTLVPSRQYGPRPTEHNSRSTL